MKRFYKQVSVVAVPGGGDVGGWEVRLDGRVLRTPAKKPMVLRQEALARALAAEWDAQIEEIVPPSMPMMQLVATAMDRVMPDREAIVAAVAAYAETDLLCYRAEHPADLVARQTRIWQPLLDWAALRFDAALMVHHGIMPRPQPAGACRALRAAVEELDDWALTAVEVATAACGSLVLALALMEGRIDAAEAFEASVLEENFQIEKWGEDPEATRRRAGLRADIVASRQFLDLLRG